ncbi:MAG: outer membrane lipoprotein-sorting protein [Saprospirales bacterium]|nr:outer membrane lipoprotein-sorting protein [Saprospirales bacterium]
MKIKSLLLAVGILLSASAVSHAQTADEVIGKYLETIGGTDAWTSFNSMRVTGKAIQMGVNYPFTVISMRPNLTKVVADVMGKEFIEAYDGESAWGLNPFAGGTAPQKSTEEESKEAAMQHFESDFINYRDKGYTVDLEGKEEIEGTECYKLKLVKEEGREEYHFIDAENYVPIMMRSFLQTGQMKGQAVETYFSDYQEVEGTGVLIAYTMEQRFNGQVAMQMVTEKVEFNPEDLTKEAFAFPEK